MLYAPPWITFEFSYGFWTEKTRNKRRQFSDRQQEENFDRISSLKLRFAATFTFQSVSRPNTPVWAETRKQSLALSGVTALYFSALLPLIPQGGFRGNGRDGKAGCSTQNTEKCKLFYTGRAVPKRLHHHSINSHIYLSQTPLWGTIGEIVPLSMIAIGWKGMIEAKILIQNRRPLGEKWLAAV